MILSQVMQPVKGVTNVKFKEEVNIALSKVRMGRERADWRGDERGQGACLMDNDKVIKVL